MLALLRWWGELCTRRMPDSCGQRPSFERRRLPTPRSGAQRGAATYHPRREARSGSVSADAKGEDPRMARVAHALSSARGESHGPAARGAGGSIPHKNPPFRPSGRIPVRDAKRRGRREARSGREKRGHGERGFARGPSSKRRSLYHRTWGFGVAHGAPHRDRSDPFVPIGARGVGPLARGFSARARIVGNSTPLTALRGGTSKNRVGNKLGRNDPKSGVRLDAGDPRKDNFPAHGVGHRVENRFRSDEVCREPKRTNSLRNVRKSRHDIQTGRAGLPIATHKYKPST